MLVCVHVCVLGDWALCCAMPCKDRPGCSIITPARTKHAAQAGLAFKTPLHSSDASRNIPSSKVSKVNKVLNIPSIRARLTQGCSPVYKVNKVVSIPSIRAR